MTPNLQIVLTAKNLTGGAFAQLRKDIGGVKSPVNELKNTFAALGAAVGVGALAKSFLDAGVYMDRMTKALSNISGGIKPAIESIQYLRSESQRLGQVFQDQVKGYTLLAAATRGTVLAGRQTEQMYSDLMEATTAFQLSQEDAYLSVRAIQQMLNKGKIQAEEFRGQFGERIPAAFEALKVVLGKTDQQISVMMERGQLYSADIVPSLLRVIALMNKSGLAESTKSAQAEINRLKNAWFEFRASIMDSGITASLAENLRSVTDSFRKYVKDHEDGIRKSVESALDKFKDLGDKVKEIFSGIATAMENSVVRNVTEYGALGYAIFGTRAGMVIGAIYAAGELLRQSKTFGAVAGGAIGVKEGFQMTSSELDARLRKVDERDSQLAQEQSLRRVRERLAAVNVKIAALEGIIGSQVKSIEEGLPGDLAFLVKKGLQANEAKLTRLMNSRGELMKAVGVAKSTAALPTMDPGRLREGIGAFNLLKTGGKTPEQLIADEKKKVADALAKRGEEEGGKQNTREAERQAKIAERRAEAIKRLSEMLTGFEESYGLKMDKLSGKFSEREIKILEVEEATRKLNERMAETANKGGAPYDPEKLKALSQSIISDINTTYSPEKAKAELDQYVASATAGYDEILSKKTEEQIENDRIKDQFDQQVDDLKKKYGVTIKYADAWEEVASKIRLSQDLLKRQDIAKEIGDEFAYSITDGIERGFSSIGDNVIGVLTNKLQEQTSKAIASAVVDSIGTGAMSSILGPVVGAAAGGLLGSVVNSVFGSSGSKYDEIYKAQRELASEIRENTKATQENTRFKLSGDVSSYSGDIFGLQTSAESAVSTLISQMKELKNPIKIFDIGESVDKISGLTGFINSLGSVDIDTGGWGNALEVFKDMEDTFRTTGKEIPAGLQSIIATLEEFKVDINNVQSGILKTARGMWEDAGDAFRTESEIQKREVERSGRDILMGLADSMRLEGVALKPVWKEVMGVKFPTNQQIDSGYLQDLSKLSSVDEVSRKLLSDLIPGTEEYNQVLEASLLIYETAVLKQKAMISSFSTSVSDWRTELEQRKWGLGEWADEFTRIGNSIEGLNVLSDSYFSESVSLAEKQFGALKNIVSLSEAQLNALQDSSKSLADQLWEFTKGGESDTTSATEWMKRGESMYLKASETLSSSDISEFQQFLPQLQDAMLASGYQYSYVTDQFKWALSTLLDKVNTSMDSVSKSIDKLPELAPTVQPINITLKIDGRELSNVIIEQLNTNTNLINAVRRVA